MDPSPRGLSLVLLKRFPMTPLPKTPTTSLPAFLPGFLSLSKHSSFPGSLGALLTGGAGLLLLILYKLNVVLGYVFVLLQQKLLDLAADVALHDNLLATAGGLGDGRARRELLAKILGHFFELEPKCLETGHRRDKFALVPLDPLDRYDTVGELVGLLLLGRLGLGCLLLGVLGRALLCLEREGSGGGLESFCHGDGRSEPDDRGALGRRNRLGKGVVDVCVCGTVGLFWARERREGPNLETISSHTCLGNSSPARPGTSLLFRHIRSTRSGGTGVSLGFELTWLVRVRFGQVGTGQLFTSGGRVQTRLYHDVSPARAEMEKSFLTLAVYYLPADGCRCRFRHDPRGTGWKTDDREADSSTGIGTMAGRRSTDGS